MKDVSLLSIDLLVWLTTPVQSRPSLTSYTLSVSLSLLIIDRAQESNRFCDIQ